MTMKSSPTRSILSRSLLIFFATVVVTLAAMGLTSSAFQRKGQQAPNGNLQIPDYSHVLITGDAVRDLPSGENRLVWIGDGVNAATSAGSGVWKVKNGGSEISLTKIGSGTLILPNARSSTGINKAGAGELRNSAHPSMTKELTGTLTLATSQTVVYEFTHLGIFKFENVLVPVGGSSADLKTHILQNRPAGAMTSWPSQRLLIGPAAGIAQIERWSAGTTNSGAGYVCQGNFCQCNGASECLGLAQANSCASVMNCDGAGSAVKCYCKAR